MLLMLDEKEINYEPKAQKNCYEYPYKNFIQISSMTEVEKHSQALILTPFSKVEKV